MLPISYTCAPTQSSESLDGVVLAFRDDTEQIRYETQLAHHAFHDQPVFGNGIQHRARGNHGVIMPPPGKGKGALLPGEGPGDNPRDAQGVAMPARDPANLVKAFARDDFLVRGDAEG